MNRDADQHFIQAMALEEQENLEEAIREYEAALCEDPRHARACLHRAFLFVEVGQLDVALVELRKAWELQHGLSALLNDDARRAFYERKVQRVLDTFNGVIQRNPNNAYLHYRLGLVHRYLGLVEKAVRCLIAAIELNPKLFEAYTASGEIYIDLQQYPLATNILKQGIEIDPQHAEMHAQLAIAYERQNMAGLALQSMETAVELDGESARYHLYLGRLLARHDRHKHAIQEYQRSMELDRSNPAVHIALAEACESVYRPDLAIHMLREAVSLDPQLGEAHFKLGKALFQLGQPEEAVTSFSQALEINPGDSYTHYHLAEAYERLGQLEAAVPHFAQAATLNPQDSYAHFNLGRTLDRLGRSREARAHLERAVRLNTKDPGMQRALDEVRARAAAEAVGEDLGSAPPHDGLLPPAAAPAVEAPPRLPSNDAFESLDGPVLWDETFEDEAEMHPPQASDLPLSMGDVGAAAPEASASENDPPSSPDAPLPLFDRKPFFQELEASLPAEPVLPRSAARLLKMPSVGSRTVRYLRRPAEEVAHAAADGSSAATPQPGLEEDVAVGAHVYDEGAAAVAFEPASREEIPAPFESDTLEETADPSEPAAQEQIRAPFEAPGEGGTATADECTVETQPATATDGVERSTPAMADDRLAGAASGFSFDGRSVASPRWPSPPPAPPLMPSSTAASPSGAASTPTAEGLAPFVPPPLPLPFAPPTPPASSPLQVDDLELDNVSVAPAEAAAAGHSDYERSVLDLSNGRLNDARARLQEVLQNDEDNYRAMYFLSLCLRFLGDKFLAAQFLTIGLKAAEEANDEAFITMFRADARLDSA